MFVPLPAAQLVPDEPVRGVRIRYSQQRLGEAHQHHPFLAGQVELLQERIQAAVALFRAADCLDQAGRAGAEAVAMGVEARGDRLERLGHDAVRPRGVGESQSDQIAVESGDRRAAAVERLAQDLELPRGATL